MRALWRWGQSFFPAAVLGLAGPHVALAGPAESEPLSFRWEGEHSCPSEARVRTAVEAYLGRKTHDAPDAPTRIAVDAQETQPGQWVAQIRIETASGAAERTLDAGQCAVLADATALIVALAIDPTVLGREVETGLMDEPGEGLDAPEQPEAVEAEPPWEPKPASQPEPKTAEPVLPTRVRLRGAVRISGGIVFAVLPGVSGGLVGALGLLRRRLWAEMSGGHWFARPIRSGGQQIGSVRLTTGGLRVCPVVRLSIVEVPLCVGAQLGAMFAQTPQVTEPGRDRLLWAAITAGPGLVISPFRAFALVLRPELVVPISRPRFLVDGIGPVHQPAPAAFQLLVGGEARFP